MHKKLQGKNFNSRMLAKVFQSRSFHVSCHCHPFGNISRCLVPEADSRMDTSKVCSFVKKEEPWDPERAGIIGTALVCGSEEPVNQASVKVPTQETALNHLKLFFGIKGRSKKKEEDEEVVPVKARDSDSDSSSEESETDDDESVYSEEVLGGDSDS
jgi:hypothetical protein